MHVLYTQVRDVFMKLPNRDLQIITLSATLPPEVLSVRAHFLTEFACSHFYMPKEFIKLSALVYTCAHAHCKKVCYYTPGVLQLIVVVVIFDLKHGIHHMTIPLYEIQMTN